MSNRIANWQPLGIEVLEPAAMQALKEDKSVLVTAGAGAGKTEFLAQKAAYLLQTGLCPAPQRILAISFKKDAAANLKERINKRCTPELARRFDSYTFDGFAKGLLDRFINAVPAGYRPHKNYEMFFPGKSHFQIFLRENKQRITDYAVFEKALAVNLLPIDTGRLTRKFWQEALFTEDKSYLSFSMVNRLVEYLLRENPLILQSLRLTYPVVFLDEFQDTTTAQFQLLCTAFSGSSCQLTAVGDDKQKIMGWAGAMHNVFEVFETTFSAKRIELLSNWRSHTELVELQQRIALAINLNAPLVQARGTKTISDDVSAIWSFDRTSQKYNHIAQWIVEQIKQVGLKPEDFALLVRMKADEFETQLKPVLTAAGLKLRNEARRIGNIDIQEIMVQELTQILLPIFYLGASRRNPAAWADATDKLNQLQGLLADDEQAQQDLRKGLEQFTQALRQNMENIQPSPKSASELSELIINFVGKNEIKKVIAAYQNPDEFDRVWQGFVGLMQEAAEDATSWQQVLDEFKGKNQVPLMTIHKSKGLEYHTVIFLGLDSNSWWSLKPSQPEELNAFFVAITRAKQRAFFTSVKEKGKPNKWIEELLEN